MMAACEGAAAAARLMATISLMALTWLGLSATATLRRTAVCFFSLFMCALCCLRGVASISAVSLKFIVDLLSAVTGDSIFKRQDEKKGWYYLFIYDALMSKTTSMIIQGEALFGFWC